MSALVVTGDPDSDAFISSNSLALLVGMLLDQQVPLSWAFRGPSTLATRLGHLDAAAIAAMDPEELVALCCEKPAIHRYPAAMARRIHALCAVLAERYAGDAATLWSDAASGDELARRLAELPGFGPEKTKITIAVLAKRFGVRPDGWARACAPFDDDQPRSVADAADAEALERIKQWKASMRSAGRTKQESPPA